MQLRKHTKKEVHNRYWDSNQELEDVLLKYCNRVKTLSSLFQRRFNIEKAVDNGRCEMMIILKTLNEIMIDVAVSKYKWFFDTQWSWSKQMNNQYRHDILTPICFLFCSSSWCCCLQRFIWFVFFFSLSLSLFPSLLPKNFSITIPKGDHPIILSLYTTRMEWERDVSGSRSSKHVEIKQLFASWGIFCFPWCPNKRKVCLSVNQKTSCFFFYFNLTSSSFSPQSTWTNNNHKQHVEKKLER